MCVVITVQRANTHIHPPYEDSADIKVVLLNTSLQTFTCMLSDDCAQESQQQQMLQRYGVNNKADATTQQSGDVHVLVR